MESSTTFEEVPSWNEETLRAIQETQQGINLKGPYYSIEELKAALESDDEETKAARAKPER